MKKQAYKMKLYFPAVFKKGFATLEILIALTILTLVMSAILTVSFGNQSLVSDTWTEKEAMTKAEEMLEAAEDVSEKDFETVVPLATTTDGIYEKALYVENAGAFIKKATARIQWKKDHAREGSLALSVFLTDTENAVGGNTCDSFNSGDWMHPHIKNPITDFADLIGDSGATYSISDVDAYQKKLYISVGNTSLKTKETFFVFDITEPARPTLLGKIDNATSTSDGPTSLVVASSSLGAYAFMANGNNADFSKCSAGPACAQVQVIDVKDARHPALVANYEIPTSSPPFTIGSGGKATGKSIFYKDGFLYLGLSQTKTGPEFNILDVHDPKHPVWIGGFSIGYTVHAILVKDGYAFVAHATSNAGSPEEQLTILDIHDPKNPFRAGGYFYPGGILNTGKSLARKGDNLFLGRLASRISGARDAIPEFYAFNTKDLSKSELTLLGSTTLPTPESLHALLVRDTLAFFTTTSQFQIWNIGDLSRITLGATLPLPGSGGTFSPSMDCEENIIYTVSNDSGNRGYISVIESEQ